MPSTSLVLASSKAFPSLRITHNLKSSKNEALGVSWTSPIYESRERKIALG
jgi:hypothetical protein